MKKLFYLIPALTFSLSGMDAPIASLPDLIKFKGSSELRKNKGFIAFEKAKIRAYKDYLLQEINRLTSAQDDIYTVDRAKEIIEDSYTSFGGVGMQNPVPGYLESLENLEKGITLNSLHSLAGKLYELERAHALAQQGYTIIEFGPLIQIPTEDRAGLNKQPNTYLIMDIDIYARDQHGEPLLEEVKSYQFCSDKTEQELCAIIHGMKALKENYGIACKLHTKYRAPESVQECSRANDVPLASDRSQKMSAPNRPPRLPNKNNPDLIDPARIKINVPSACIVCYDEIAENRRSFISLLEKAYVDYIKIALSNESRLRPYLGHLIEAQKKFRHTPGFLPSILMPIAIQAEEKNWSKVRSYIFEMLSALDAPKDQRVIAFGAELYFDQANPKAPHDAPQFKATNEGYLIQKKANSGYDLDVLLQDAQKPQCYSFIEATTGPSQIKSFEKFQGMGKALAAEVYVLHNFDHTKFERTAYWKHPALIKIPNRSTPHELPWHLACRTQTCLHQIDSNKNMYKPIVINMNEELYSEFFYEFNRIYNRLKDAHNGTRSSVWSHEKTTAENTTYVFDNLNQTITEIFKCIDDVNSKANEHVYKIKIQRGLLKLMAQEKENKCIGNTAFAALLLTQLNCTIQDKRVRERYLTTTAQYSLDLNSILKGALNLAIEAVEKNDDEWINAQKAKPYHIE